MASNKSLIAVRLNNHSNRVITISISETVQSIKKEEMSLETKKKSAELICNT